MSKCQQKVHRNIRITTEKQHKSYYLAPGSLSYEHYRKRFKKTKCLTLKYLGYAPKKTTKLYRK